MIFRLPPLRLGFVGWLVLLLAGCTKEYGPQRLDFINTARYTSSNRTGLGVADTLASRLYAENTDTKGASLGRLVVTVNYRPRRNPFLYPTPLSSFNRDSIDKSTEDFVFLDSTLASATNSQLLTTTYGVRTTTGTERWTYDLYNTSGDKTASRAVQLSMRRSDSLNAYQDYTLRLVIPAVGVSPGAGGIGRTNSSRRFLSLLPGLALPEYTVVKAGAPAAPQAAAQKLIDLIILGDGLTLVSPTSPTLSAGTAPGLNAARWPVGNRRDTRIYPTQLTAATFGARITDADITADYNTAQSSAAGSTVFTGTAVGPVNTGQVYAFRTTDKTGSSNYRYGLLLVLSVPTTTTTSATSGLQLQVRMAKL